MLFYILTLGSKYSELCTSISSIYNGYNVCKFSTCSCQINKKQQVDQVHFFIAYQENMVLQLLTPNLFPLHKRILNVVEYLQQIAHYQYMLQSNLLTLIWSSAMELDVSNLLTDSLIFHYFFIVGRLLCGRECCCSRVWYDCDGLSSTPPPLCAPTVSAVSTGTQLTWLVLSLAASL